MLYLTEYAKQDGMYSDTVEASSWAEAERIAENRGRGEKVVGSHVATLAVATRADADAVVDAMNERDRVITH